MMGGRGVRRRRRRRRRSLLLDLDFLSPTVPHSQQHWSRAEPSDTGTVEEDTGERSEREVSPGSVQAAAAAKEDEKK